MPNRLRAHACWSRNLRRCWAPLYRQRQHQRQKYLQMPIAYRIDPVAFSPMLLVTKYGPTMRWKGQRMGAQATGQDDGQKGTGLIIRFQSLSHFFILYISYSHRASNSFQIFQCLGGTNRQLGRSNGSGRIGRDGVGWHSIETDQVVVLPPASLLPPSWTGLRFPSCSLKSCARVLAPQTF